MSPPSNHTISPQFSTQSIHLGSDPDPVTGAVIPPLSLSTTYVQPGVGLGKYEYSRSSNPNRNALETVLSGLERGAASAAEGGSVVFSSGSAATAAICQWLVLPAVEGGGKEERDGDQRGRVLSISDVYGGTYRYLTRLAATTTSLDVDFLPMSNLTGPELLSAISPSTSNSNSNSNSNSSRTKLIWLESPTNPLLVLPPLQLISQTIASLPESERPLVLVDNTFLSPYWSNPLTLGADVVLHSLSKYLNGHSDVIMGALVLRKGLEGRMGRGLRFLQNASGAVPSPFDCFLAQRGIKTLPLRALQHGLNALYIAKNLSSNPLIAEINYPGLASSEFYERAKWSLSQQAKKDLTSLGWEFDPSHQEPSEKERERGGIPFSGMITIRLRATEAQTEKFLLTLRYFSLAESLGGVESLAEAPWKMTHGSIPEEERRKAGITEDLVRLSVGIEDKEDLLRDLENALRVAIEGGE